MRYPADRPTVEEIVAVMRHASDDRHGWRVRAMIVVLWRAELRIQEALNARPELPVESLFCIIDGPARRRRGRAPPSAPSSAD